MSTSEALRRLAERVSKPPHAETFVGGALAAWKAARGLDDDGLAAFLGCPVDNLPKLALCRRPDLSCERFEADVQKIAGYAGVNRDRLAEVLLVVASAGQ